MSIEEDTKIIEDTEPLCEEPVKEETNEVIQKPKVKKPRSEAQVKAFEIARQKLAEKRKVNRANKDKELAVKIKEKELEQRKVREVSEKFERLLDEDEDEPVVITKPKARKKKAKQKVVIEEEDNSSDSEPEIVIRRIRRGRKKKQEEPEPTPPLPLPVEEPIQQEEQPLPKRYSNAMLLKAFGM